MKLYRALLLLLIATTTMSAASQLIFIGTYTPKDGTSHGIYAVQMDPATGALSAPVLAAETANPTFLALHPNGRTVYSICESTGADGKSGGAAAAYQIDAAKGTLSLVNTQVTGGAGCAHVVVDATGRLLVLSSYRGAYFTTFPLDGTGRIGPHGAHLIPTGALGPNQARQEQPHPHSVTFSPDNRFAYGCDLGLDKIFCYRVDPATASLSPAGEFATAPGAGPRHSRFSADGQYYYVIDELNNTISAFTRDVATGALTPLQSLSTLPADFKGASGCAEIRIDPNGRFVYGSNRGHDSLAVFARSAADGRLTAIQTISSGGGHPRNFALSPDGHWLICANRDSNNLVVFKVDSATGKLTPTGHTATVPQAVCVLFVPAQS